MPRGPYRGQMPLFDSLIQLDMARALLDEVRERIALSGDDRDGIGPFTFAKMPTGHTRFGSVS